MGRAVQTVSKGTATIGAVSGDIVSFNEYDQFGRQNKGYLPYTTTAQPGKLKSGIVAAQESYYLTNFNETSPFNEVTAYDNSPLNRQKTVKSSGTTWADASANGNKKEYEFNTSADEVRAWVVGDYVTKFSQPYDNGAYVPYSLYKYTSLDENNKKVIEYINKSGQLVLKKVQISDYYTSAHGGWSCTYYVYDDFGRLHCTIEPEATAYCAQTGDWIFQYNTDVLTGYCYFYEYDKKGRQVAKRSPGAEPLYMLYDKRDRLIFTQDGNQRTKHTAPYQEWSATLYDELDLSLIHI